MLISPSWADYKSGKTRKEGNAYDCKSRRAINHLDDTNSSKIKQSIGLLTGQAGTCSTLSLIINYFFKISTCIKIL